MSLTHNGSWTAPSSWSIAGSSSLAPTPSPSPQPPPYTKSHSTLPSSPSNSTPSSQEVRTSSEKQIIRSSLWFNDGNLIIHAPPVQFKVYAGILAARSSVFNDMLAFPPPKEGNETVDGCVVVRLFGDEPGDVRWFLMALLDSSFFEPPPAPTTLPILRAILRLSKKYHVPYLYNRALSHLTTTFPTTLDAWKNRDETRTIPPVNNTPFVVLQVAREMGLDWIVPSVVYCICSHPIRKTMKGAWWAPPGASQEEAGLDTASTASEEGESDEEDDEDGDEEEGRRGTKIRLSEHDKDMAILAREKLKEMQVKAVVRLISAHAGERCETWVHPSSIETVAAAVQQAAVAAGAAAAPGPQTPNPPPGAPAALGQLHVPPAPAAAPAPTVAPVPPHPHTLAPFTCLSTRIHSAEIVSSWEVAGLLDFHIDSRPLLGRMCEPCREVYKRECERLAREMWDALPGFCGLGSWGELEGRRREGGL